MVLQTTGLRIGPPVWFVNINPFALAWAPYDGSGGVGIESYLLAILAALVLSAGLVAYAVLRLRAEAAKGSRARAMRAPTWISRGFAWVQARRRSPSLDHDPVLWRECRRGRPTRLARIIWGFYAALALAGTVWTGFIACNGGSSESIELLSGLQAAFGLLLVCIHAPTVLAEERARGSLDVLMTTPVSTDRIVLAKWWGAFRVVPALALLPAIGALVAGITEPEIPAAFARSSGTHDPIGLIDRVAFVCLPTALFLAQGAAVTSFGLALATWMRRVGRAIAAGVAVYALVSLGWLLSLELDILADTLSWFGFIGPDDFDAERFVTLIGVSLCPLGAQLGPFQSVTWAAAATRHAFYIGNVIVFLLTVGVAFVFLGLTLATFNRSMGRMSEQPRRAPRPPRAVRAARKPHKPESQSHEPVPAPLNACGA
jgi:ABC-2 family transporter protein